MRTKFRTELDSRNGQRIIVELTEGVLRDEVVAWQEWPPCHPPVQSRRTCWHRGGRGVELYHDTVDAVIALARPRRLPPPTTPPVAGPVPT